MQDLLSSTLPLRTFQRTFIKAALSPQYNTAVLSTPRANGKSWLAAAILIDCLTPGGALHEPGKEYLLGSGAIDQARMVFGPIKAALGDNPEYRFSDSVSRLAVTHKPTDTKLRVISSNGRTAMGVVNTPVWVFDEAGSFEVDGGQLLWDAAVTAQGKPNSPLKLILIGTLAPALGGWWHDLISDGTHGSTYVQTLQANPERWDQWSEIRRCNPLTAVSAEFRKVLLAERDAAYRDSRLRARFLSYRLNLPTADESQMLLSADELERVLARPVPERVGAPVVGIDLGGGRAWSAAVAQWENGRIEAIALAPGIPSIEAQEKRDRVPRGSYQKLVNDGSLRVAHGLHKQPPDQLVNAMLDMWGKPKRVIVDRFRLDELKDAGKGLRIEERVTRWSDAASDIRALRKFSSDGPLAVEHGSRLLLTASLLAALVLNDDQGNTRLTKRSHNVSRDDVAAALLLSAGGVDRDTRKPSSGVQFGGLA